MKKHIGNATLPEIQYQLHNAALIAIGIGPGDKVDIVVELHPKYNRGKPWIELRFGGVLNCEEVQDFVDRLETAAHEEEYVPGQIDCFEYDTTQASTINDYWFSLMVEGSESVRIHCSEMTTRELNV